MLPTRARITRPAPAPRWRGSSSAAHRLTAARSQGWEIAVKLSRPRSPNTASSHTSLACSVSESLMASPTWRANAASTVRFSRRIPGAGSTAACTEAACARRRSCTTARNTCTRV